MTIKIRIKKKKPVASDSIAINVTEQNSKKVGNIADETPESTVSETTFGKADDEINCTEPHAIDCNGSNETKADLTGKNKPKKVKAAPSPKVQSAVQTANAYFADKEFEQFSKKHALEHDRLLRRLRRVVEGGHKKKARQVQDKIFKSYSSKLACVLRSLKKGDECNWGEVTAIAAELNPYEDCGEPVQAWYKPKTSGGHRPMCSYGIRRKALQTLCNDVLEQYGDDDEINFLKKGKGSERASDRIVHLAENGFPYFVLMDIKDFYRSVQHQGTKKALPLPKKVIEHCILNSASVLQWSLLTGPKPFDGAFREGLPQGSRTSPLVACMLLGPGLRQVTSADRIAIHGDDLAVAARSYKEAEALQKALHGMLASHPAGTFCLKRSEIKNIYEGFDFLKYRHQWRPGDDCIWRRPCKLCFIRFQENAAHILATKEPSEIPDEIYDYILAWMESFQRWHWNLFSWNLVVLTALDTCKNSYEVGLIAERFEEKTLYVAEHFLPQD